MPAGPFLQQLVGNALAASAPVSQNANYNDPDAYAKQQGYHVFTPDDALEHINSLDPLGQVQYDNIDQARKDGYDIPDHSIYHDSKGNDVTQNVLKATSAPMKQPGFWQRFVNPSAAQYETEINLQPTLAQQANTTRLGINQQNIQRGLPALGQQPSVLNAHNYAALSPDSDATSLLAANQAGTDIKNGIPLYNTAAKLAEAKAAVPVATGQATRALVGNSIGVPAAQATEELAGSKLNTGLSNIGIAELPNTASITHGRNIAELGQQDIASGLLPYQKAAVPSEGSALVSHAANEAYREKLAGIIAPYQGTAALTGAKREATLAPYAEPLPGFQSYTDENGNVTPFVRTGGLVNLQQAMTQRMLQENPGLFNNAGGAPISAITKSGKSVPLPPSGVIPSLQKQNNTQTPVPGSPGYTTDENGNLYYHGIPLGKSTK